LSDGSKLDGLELNEKLSLFLGYEGYIAEVAKEIVYVVDCHIFVVRKTQSWAFRFVFIFYLDGRIR
jgi:hypothetical protein